MENNLIQIKEYAKPKKGDGGSGGSTKITYNIDGTSVGSNLKLKSLQVNRILAEYIEANNFVGNTGNFIYFVASDGSISNLNGNRLEYNTGHIGELKADSIETDKLKVNETATIKNIFNNYLNSKEIVTDCLTVNKAAHFFEVVIDKIRSVGGTIINTATSCVIDYVEPVIENGDITGYKCYWKQTNNEDDYVSNDWLPNDQAISQNCNLVAGVNHNTSNHYYWRLVKSTSNEDTSNGPIFVNFNTGESKFGTYDQEKQKYVAPEYEITFEKFADADIGYIFKYDNRDEDPEYSVVLTDWDILPQIDDTWDVEHNKFTVKDSLHGLQLIPKSIDLGNDNYRYPNIRGGHFIFKTSVDTKLNVMIMYDNDTIEYQTAKESGTSYDIEIMNPTNALVTMIVITSDVVDVWHACHWIELGNGEGEVDVPTGDFGTEVANWDNVPAKGDNIAQLGYRYGPNATQDEISRASAIIIAAYKTPDSDIVPPSYAQYQNITDFSLNTTTRGTYMDATGAYIKGTLITESGTPIDITDDGLQVNTNYCRLIPSENPITKPKGDQTKTITFTVFNVVDGVGTEMTNSELQGWYINVNGAENNINVKQDENYFKVEITSDTNNIDVKLYNANNILKDTYVGTAVNLEDITDGKDGAWTQTIYKYVDINSSGIIDEHDQGKPQIPAGWYTNIPASQPVNTYLWYAVRLITYDNNNQPVYGRWSTYRAQGLIGTQGQQGSIGLTGEQGYQGATGAQGLTGPQGATGTQGQQGSIGLTGEQGYQGVAGQSGENGLDAEYYMLVPLRELFEVRLSGENMGTTAYTNITGDLYLDLIYAVAHVKGNVTTYLNSGELANYYFNMISDNYLGNKNWTFYNGDATDASTIVPVTIGNTSYDAFRITIPNLLTWTNTYKPSGSEAIDSNYNNYYYLHAHNQTNWMPTKINMRLLLRTTNAEQDVRSTNLTFKPSHVFSATDTALNSIYQGLSGTTGSWTTTGFSNIKQTWDNINMSVNNVKSLEYGTDIDNNINTNGIGLEQYVFYRTDTDTEPKAPNDVLKTDSGDNEWTLYTLMQPIESYKYIYISRRTRTYNATTNEYSNWSSWSKPVLYWVYNVPRTSINSAMLNIEADNIKLEVTNDLNSTGIDIENGTITLNADNTTINGQLTLNQTNNNGFILNATDDENNNRICKITAGPIDSYTTWYNKSAGSENAITALGTNGFEFISIRGGKYPGNKAYIGDDGMSFETNKNSFSIGSDGIYYEAKEGNNTYKKRYGFDYVKLITDADVSSSNNKYDLSLPNDFKWDIDTIICTYGGTSTKPLVIILGSPNMSLDGMKKTIKNLSNRTIYICGQEGSDYANMVPTYISGTSLNKSSSSPYYNRYNYIALYPGCSITLLYVNKPATTSSLWIEIASDGYYTEIGINNTYKWHCAANGTNKIN